MTIAIRVLIADDEPNQLELLSYNLSQSEFEVIRANDGQQALEMIEDHRPDLVILDWMMPNMSGIDVCRTLRSRSETKLLPVILLSARGEEGDRTLGLDVGADDYISKPLKYPEISGWTVGTNPFITFPLPPSIVIISPSLIIMFPALNCFNS